MVTKTDLHRLVDDLSENTVEKAATPLGRLNDPLARLLDEAPEDPEPLTGYEETAIEEGRADLRAGRVLSDEELRRELGL